MCSVLTSLFLNKGQKMCSVFTSLFLNKGEIMCSAVMLTYVEMLVC